MCDEGLKKENKKIAAIIQARLGSTRLPGKAFLRLEGETLLGHLVTRIRISRHIEDVIIATTTEERDDAIVAWAKEKGLPVYRGSEEDVLDRVYRAAQQFGAQIIVRVTPDCPMLDPEVTDTVIAHYLKGDYDYVSNTLQPTYPDGLDTEVFSFQVLETAWRQARLPSEREHVTAYISKHPERFRLHNVRKKGEDLSHMRWTVDTPQDYEFVRQVFSHLGVGGKVFHMDDVVALCARIPALSAINEGAVRNEGYAISLKKDKKHKIGA